MTCRAKQAQTASVIKNRAATTRRILPWVIARFFIANSLFSSACSKEFAESAKSTSLLWMFADVSICLFWKLRIPTLAPSLIVEFIVPLTKLPILAEIFLAIIIGIYDGLVNGVCCFSV